MSNGIDNIYDTSDVRRKLYEIGQERQKLIDQKRRRLKGTINVGKDLLSLWRTESAAKTQELLALQDQGRDVFEMNPEYLKKRGLKKFFTTPEKRVKPVEITRTERQMVPASAPGQGSPEFVEKNVTVTEPRAKDFLEANPELLESKSLVEKAGDLKDSALETSENFFKSDFGKLLSIGGVVQGLHDIGSKDFQRRSGVNQGLGYLKTGLSALSLAVPGAGIWAAGASLADVFDWK